MRHKSKNGFRYIKDLKKLFKYVSDNSRPNSLTEPMNMHNFLRLITWVVHTLKFAWSFRSMIISKWDGANNIATHKIVELHSNWAKESCTSCLCQQNLLRLSARIWTRLLGSLVLVCAKIFYCLNNSGYSSALPWLHTDTEVLVTSAIYPLLSKKNKLFDATVSTFSTWFVFWRTLRFCSKKFDKWCFLLLQLMRSSWMKHEWIGLTLKIPVLTVKFLTAHICCL